jgi:hypothetical protein
VLTEGFAALWRQKIPLVAASGNLLANKTIGGEAPQGEGPCLLRHWRHGELTGRWHLGSSWHRISLQSAIDGRPVPNSLSCFHRRTQGRAIRGFVDGGMAPQAIGRLRPRDDHGFA